MIFTKVAAYATPAERGEVFQRLAGANRSDEKFTKADIRGHKHIPPLLKADTFQGADLMIDDTHNSNISYIAAIRTVPMK
jgi:hypothetical protein